MENLAGKFYDEDVVKTDQQFFTDTEIKALNGIELSEDDKKYCDSSYYICAIEQVDFGNIKSLREYANRFGIDEDKFIIYGRIIPFKKKVEITYEIG